MCAEVEESGYRCIDRGILGHTVLECLPLKLEDADVLLQEERATYSHNEADDAAVKRWNQLWCHFLLTRFQVCDLIESNHDKDYNQDLYSKNHTTISSFSVLVHCHCCPCVVFGHSRDLLPAKPFGKATVRHLSGTITPDSESKDYLVNRCRISTLSQEMFTSANHRYLESRGFFMSTYNLVRLRHRHGMVRVWKISCFGLLGHSPAFFCRFYMF